MLPFLITPRQLKLTLTSPMPTSPAELPPAMRFATRPVVQPTRATSVRVQAPIPGKGVVGMKLIGEGQFRNDDEKKDKSIQFVMDLGKVDILNVGFEKPEEIDDFAKRLARTPRKATV